VTAVFARETRKERVKGEAPPKQVSTWEILEAPGVMRVFIIYALTMILAMGYTAVVPVFWFTSVKLGGFGFSPRMISLFLGLGGLSQSVWLLLVFPPFQRRCGTGGVLRVCSYVWPFFFACYPLGNWLLRAHIEGLFWTMSLICQVVGSGVAMAFSRFARIANFAVVD
jgi:hypothetical protein